MEQVFNDRDAPVRRTAAGGGKARNLSVVLILVVVKVGLIGPPMAQERVLISSEPGKVTAELVDNNATRVLLQMLPLTIRMRDTSARKRPGISLRPCQPSSD